MKNGILLLFAIVTIMTSCGKLQDPEFRKVEHFRLKNVGFESATVGFSATYFNPNTFGVSVKEAELDVTIDSVYIGKFTQPESIEVKDNSLFSIPLEGKISLTNVMQMNFEKMLGKEVFIKADGSVKVGKGGVFVTKDVNYQGRQKITADLIKNPAAAGFN